MIKPYNILAPSTRINMPAAASNPFVLLTSPNHCKLGVTDLVVEIVGEYFTGTCDVSFGYDVAVNHFIVINNKLIEATISIAPEAFASYKSIVVSTPDGSGALHKGFLVMH
jgi:hypothetical protein